MSTPLDQPVQFADDAYEDKTKAKPISAIDIDRTLSDHDAECLAILGFNSVASITAAFGLQAHVIHGLHAENRGLASALSERRFHQSQRKELRDEWAIQIYAKGGRTIESCYEEADKAMLVRLGKQP